MFKVGLCSVTFRNLLAEKVVEAAKEAHIHGIEWGGDIHVPPGNLKNAKYVATLTKQAGIEVVSYGSYYHLGNEAEETSFHTILDTTLNLEAPAIRVWAGRLGSDEATGKDRQAVIDDARRIADLAGEKDIHINLEYHGRTLTDTAESAARLLEEINHANVSLYWQPALFKTVEERADSIVKIRPWLTNVHVFHWKTIDKNVIKYPFSEGTNDWKVYLEKLKEDDGVRYLIMEFVKEDSVEQLKDDVETLRGLME